ncbi:hypothetical protein VTL71DRAFT_2170 [Oculimacula yallundae]|uniref:Zn(2)-C6 fungal-type domain-containing protein n=1 Tax=Oculimacula yallundae TaxID=86028 RepID=A0ABR4C841_9HELO
MTALPPFQHGPNAASANAPALNYQRRCWHCGHKRKRPCEGGKPCDGCIADKKTCRDYTTLIAFPGQTHVVINDHPGPANRSGLQAAASLVPPQVRSAQGVALPSVVQAQPPPAHAAQPPPASTPSVLAPVVYAAPVSVSSTHVIGVLAPAIQAVTNDPGFPQANIVPAVPIQAQAMLRNVGAEGVVNLNHQSQPHPPRPLVSLEEPRHLPLSTHADPSNVMRYLPLGVFLPGGDAAYPGMTPETLFNNYGIDEEGLHSLLNEDAADPQAADDWDRMIARTARSEANAQARREVVLAQTDLELRLELDKRGNKCPLDDEELAPVTKKRPFNPDEPGTSDLMNFWKS